MMDVAGVLRSYRFSFTDESELHLGIGKALAEAGINFEPEYGLGDAGRIDFFIDGLGVEVKIKESRNSVMRQLMRYAKHDKITSLILVTTRNQLRAMPIALNGKEITVVYIGGAF
jgi:hypothetical protein